MARVRHKQFEGGEKHFFQRIASEINISDTYLCHRKVKCPDDSLKRDKKIFSSLSFKRIHRFLRGDVLSIASFEGKNFLIVASMEEPMMPDGIIPVDTSMGVYLATIIECDIHLLKNKSIDDVLQYLLFPIEEPDTFDGLTMEDLYSFFPVISVYEIDDYFTDYEVELEKICLLYCCMNSSITSVALGEDVLNAFSDLAQSGFANLPYSYLLRSITATEWRYSFIELYRCLEMLFRLGRTYEAECEIHTKVQTQSVYRFLRKNAKDYYKEDTSVFFLFSLLPQSTITLLQNAGPVKGAGSFYDLRNSIAHGGKKENKQIEVKRDRDWRGIILFTLFAIHDLYDLFDSMLNSFEE